MSGFNPWPPRFMTSPASTPPSTPKSTHVTNMEKLMTFPP